MLKALDGYPAAAAASSKREWSGDYFGPASYQQPGEVVPATVFSLLAIETAGTSALSQSGTYYVKAVQPATSGVAETRAPTYGSITMQWYVTATNVQVANAVNLSAEVVRLTVRGV